MGIKILNFCTAGLNFTFSKFLKHGAFEWFGFYLVIGVVGYPSIISHVVNRCVSIWRCPQMLKGLLSKQDFLLTLSSSPSSHPLWLLCLKPNQLIWRHDCLQSFMLQCTMLQKISKCEVMVWLCWNFIILLPLWFYLKSNFGDFIWPKIVIFDNFKGSEFWF